MLNVALGVEIEGRENQNKKKSEGVGGGEENFSPPNFVYFYSIKLFSSHLSAKTFVLIHFLSLFFWCFLRILPSM